MNILEKMNLTRDEKNQLFDELVTDMLENVPARKQSIVERINEHKPQKVEIVNDITAWVKSKK